MSTKQKLTKYDIRLFGLMAACVALVFMLPESRSIEPGIINGFVWLMTSIVPSIRHSIASSSFPQLTAFYLSIIWAMTPLMCVVWLSVFRRRDALAAQSNNLSVKVARYKPSTPMPVLVIVGVLFVGSMILGPFIGHEVSEKSYKSLTIGAFLSVAPGKSKVWLAIIGGGGCWLFSLGVAVVLAFIKNNFVNFGRHKV